MKINNNCARKILLEVEKIPYGETLTINKLHENISEYSIEDVLNIVTLLNKERFLVILDKASYDDSDIFREHKIKHLTDKGFRSLDLIRNDEIWKMLKNNLDDFNDVSIYTIFDIANKIINAKHNKIFNIPNEFYNQNNRW